jgi:hypothetical protein
MTLIERLEAATGPDREIDIDLEPWDPRRDCPWKCKIGEENCRCMDEREDRRIAAERDNEGK